MHNLDGEKNQLAICANLLVNTIERKYVANASLKGCCGVIIELCECSLVNETLEANVKSMNK